MARVWVGRTDCAKVGEQGVGRLMVGRMEAGSAVEMGDKVVLEIRERVRGWVRERRLRASRGPKTSRAWKPGKRRRPMLLGPVFGGRGGGWVSVEGGGRVCSW